MMADVRKIFLCFVIIPLLLFVLPDHVTTENSTCGFNWTVCAPRNQQSCHCSSDDVTDVIISCQLSNLTNVNDIISTPQHVKRLDLSGNRIQRLSSGSFSRFTKMIYLSLASNAIHIISQGAFHGLDKLLQIDLTGNNITHWNTSTIDRELPNLQFLNVRKNIFWIPDPTILSLPRLQVISLLLTCMWKYDITCYLVKHNTIRNADCNERQGKKHLKKIDNPNEIMRTDKLNELLSELTAVTCFEGKLMFRDSNFIDVSEDKGFRFQCEVQEVLNRKCFRPFNTTTGPKFYIGVADTCWSITGLIHIITTTAGILALVLNITVILTTLRSRILRESVAHVLVANIAVGDLLVSFYLITVISTRQSMSELEFHNLHVPYFCRVFGILFLIGQFSSSMLSFVMTLERYLAVVYCMRPQIRITMGTCLAVMAMAWGLSISIAVSFMTSKEFSTDTNHMCVPSPNVNHTQVLAIVGGIGVLLYILSIALYGLMYLDFRRTHQKTVQLKRENRLARRIALILFTNVFFIILPLIISSAIKISALEDKVSSKDKSILWNTLAVTCLGVNSFLNPVLFSFRNEKFRTEFRKRLSPCNNSIDTQSES